MEIEYRDYGAIDCGASAPLVPIETERYSQVFWATHDNEKKRLLHMERSFISFSFGGKYIEDFDLLAIIENNAMQKNLYADFKDNITENDIWEGQLYWDTHLKSFKFTFRLFTDGIDERTLDAFKHWFRPGRVEELILEEHPNRAILARVNSVPVMSMLPFEEKITKMIAGQEINTSTTLYKGAITLELISDEPYWYSRVIRLDRRVLGEYDNGTWVGANDEVSMILNDKDALKVIWEDGVPYSEMFNVNNVQFITGEDSEIADLSQGFQGSRVGDATGLVTTKDNETDPLYTTYPADLTRGAMTASNGAGGHTAYRLIYYGNIDGVELSQKNVGYFYYPGTAPCKPTISFNYRPVRVNNQYNITENYLFFVAPSGKQTKLQFSLPLFFSSYNEMILLIQTISDSAIKEDWLLEIRNKIKHYKVRQLAVQAVNSLSIMSKSSFLTAFNQLIPNRIQFHCKMNLATGEILVDNFIASQTTTDQERLYEITEKAGYMLLSNDLIIDERCHFSDEGYVVPEKCYKVYTNDIVLESYKMEYKYLYY